MEIAIYKSQNLSGGGGTKHKLYSWMKTVGTKVQTCFIAHRVHDQKPFKVLLLCNGDGVEREKALAWVSLLQNELPWTSKHLWYI